MPQSVRAAQLAQEYSVMNCLGCEVKDCWEMILLLTMVKIYCI